ncbi:alanine racemase [Microbacterium sp. NPDC058342]|uniref:alanine racemase n=1 Tax=Microbacterium sp. NPDC058342 TaxID=3346454 RepID=UPI00365FB15B
MTIDRRRRIPGTGTPAGTRFTGPTLELIPQAVAENLRRMRTGGPVMAVVKADGYGHGALAVASAALDAGAEWLGVTDVAEGVRLREVGAQVPILAWLHPAGIDAEAAAACCVDVAVGSVDELAELIRVSPGAVRVHLHLDTGMSRGGCPVQDLPELLRVARRGRDAGRIEVVGIMGHLPDADLADPHANLPWILRMRHARDTALRAGFAPLVTHLGATAAALTDPATRFDLTRVGAGLVGIDPSGTVELAAAGRFTAPVVHSAEVAAGTPVGYAGTHVADRATRLSVVGVGYADGIPRELSREACVAIGGRRHRIVGRVSMDQIVVDTGATSYPRGSVATVFGPDHAAPTVQDWAGWAGTIPHTIVTGIGGRVARGVA